MRFAPAVYGGYPSFQRDFVAKDRSRLFPGFNVGLVVNKLEACQRCLVCLGTQFDRFCAPGAQDEQQ